MSDIVFDLLRPPQDTSPTKTSSPSQSPSSSASPTKDPAIIRTLRTTLSSNDVFSVAHGPVWALSVLSHLIVLLGPVLRMNKSLQGIISALFAVAVRHPSSSVRSLVCVVWRSVIWSYFRPPLVALIAEDEADNSMVAEAYDGLDDEIDLCGLLEGISDKEKKVRESYWNVVKTAVEWGAGVATIGSLLHLRSDEEDDMKKVIYILKALVKKSGLCSHDAIDLMRCFLSGFHSKGGDDDSASDGEGWKWSKLLPERLFSAVPGLLTVEFEDLHDAVKEIVCGFELGPPDVRPLTSTELSFDGVWDGMVEVWLEMVEQCNVVDQLRLHVSFISMLP